MKKDSSTFLVLFAIGFIYLIKKKDSITIVEFDVNEPSE